jgi:undecaprenyl-diphosphatase
MGRVGALRSNRVSKLRLRKAAKALPAISAGTALFVASGVAAKRAEIHPAERTAFTSLNGLSDTAHRPVWAVMQAGSLGAVAASALVALACRRRDLAVALGVAGSTVWGGAKLVKRGFGRGRPAAHLESTRIRGREASGLGFPSGHAAVSMTLATIACPELPHPGPELVYAVAALTALGRVYVGAHLPADVVGGVGLGLAAGSLTNVVRAGSATRSR